MMSLFFSQRLPEVHDLCPQRSGEEVRQGGSRLHATAPEERRVATARDRVHRVREREPRVPQTAPGTRYPASGVQVRVHAVEAVRGVLGQLKSS